MKIGPAVFMATFFRPPRFLLRDRASKRPDPHATKLVRCYRCGRSLEISAHAESGSCPHCAGNLRLLDIEITKGHWGTSLLTTGTIHVHKDAKVVANLLIASGDITIEGIVDGMCISGATTRITESGELKGGTRTAKLIVEPGALIRGSLFETPSKALGTIDVDAAVRARPGKGPASEISFKHPQRSAPPCKPEPIIETKQATPIASGLPRLRVVR